jgi:cytochrome bd ubiquinol oxidase subunit II
MGNVEMFQELWFVLIAILFAGYSILDGFDLGIGSLLPILGKTKEDKDTLINSIGPVWDGNEVWLVTGGGALFAAFPQAYATSFSGFYLAFMGVLFCLIFRAVSFEFRAHSAKHARAWEWALTCSSLVASLLFGVALGNVVVGVPLDSRMEYAGTFLTLLKPVPCVFGLMGLSAFLMQGAAWAILKTEGALQERAYRAARILAVVELVVFIVFAAAVALAVPGSITNPLFIAGAVLALLGIAGIRSSVKKENERAPFWESSAVLIGLWLMVAGVQYPNLIRAAGDPALSITIRNASTSLLTLKIMSVIALIGMPIVIGYSIFVYRIFKGKARKGAEY